VKTLFLNLRKDAAAEKCRLNTNTLQTAINQKLIWTRSPAVVEIADCTTQVEIYD